MKMRALAASAVLASVLGASIAKAQLIQLGPKLVGSDATRPAHQPRQAAARGAGGREE